MQVASDAALWLPLLGVAQGDFGVGDAAAQVGAACVEMAVDNGR